MRQELKEFPEYDGSLCQFNKKRSSHSVLQMDGQDAFNDVVKISQINLRILGIWPDPQRTDDLRTICQVMIIFILIFFFINIPQTIKLWMVRSDLDGIIDILCTADISVAVGLMMICVLWYNKETLKPLVALITEDWMKSSKTEDELEIMQKMAKTSRKISIICVILAQGTYNVKVVTEVFFNINQKINGRKNQTRLFLVSYFPYNTVESPNFELTWFGQWLAVLFATLAYSGVDSFFGVLVLHLCGQFAALKFRLIKFINSVVNQASKTNFQNEFSNIINRHSLLYRCVATIEDSFNLMFLAQMLACSIQFCLQGYQLLSIISDYGGEQPIVDLIFMGVFLIYMMGHFYIYCYVSEQLRFHTTEFSYAAYQCKWFILKSNEAKNLLFLMARAKKPGEITAGKFCSLSLEVFNKILKNSMGYLSVLLATKRKQAEYKN